MTTQIKPETAARIAALATRLGFTGSDASDRVLQLALDHLESQTKEKPRAMTPAEKAAEKKRWAEIGERNRTMYPFEDSNPPSKYLQDELYDESALPK